MSEQRHPVHGGPLTCHRGHDLAPGRVLVSWGICDCTAADDRGHHTWTCAQCGDVVGHEPADYRPPPPTLG